MHVALSVIGAAKVCLSLGERKCQLIITCSLPPVHVVSGTDNYRYAISR